MKTRLVGVAVSIVVLLVVWRWFLPGPPMVLNPTTKPPLVERGVAMVMVCGEDVGFRDLLEKVPTSVRWSVTTQEKRGECTVWFHHAESGSD